ncbi:MAG: hypothetical protein Barrevirus1_25 [Barrevirus sp.]|uniref:Uncharacterized protein n=1 Tax=Barrevirus sp. TaxID=2487763 RepID=A0A3G4ZT66_9VIRU|nr:MAG: hypothetical protein Barrevirus1_25 [Barrevirus sp.]
MISNDALTIIFSYLSFKDIKNCRLTCKQYCHVIDNKYIFNGLCEKDYPGIHNLFNRATAFEKYKCCNSLKGMREQFNMNYKELESFIKLDVLGVIRRLTNMPKAIGLLTNLSYINITSNILETLPKQIGYLTNLKSINLTNNRIRVLPDEIGSLVNLEILYMCDNNLEYLPKTIGKLTNLVRLDLKWNPLIELPEEIGQMINLRYLNLNFTSLIDLPMQILNIENLESVMMPQRMYKKTKRIRDLNKNPGPEFHYC